MYILNNDFINSLLSVFFQRAFPRYESAYSITKETGDRKLQLEVLSGMAKCAAAAGDLEQVHNLSIHVREIRIEIDGHFSLALRAHDLICFTTDLQTVNYCSTIHC